MPQPLLALMGPTASGKTALAIELVRRMPVEIISVDSALIYRGMDIGTGKPSAADQAVAPHRLIDICDPTETYSAARFADDARLAIAAVRQAGRVPLLVGGTMLYFRALLQGLAAMPSADPQFREALEQEAIAEGWPALHARLAERDPEAAARIHSNDAQRIQRALEVLELSGETISQWHRKPLAANAMHAHSWVLSPVDRGLLHQRIAKRLDAMLAAGFVAEVQALKDRPDLHLQLPSMRSVRMSQPVVPSTGSHSKLWLW